MIGVRILRAKPGGGATTAIGSMAVNAGQRSGLLWLRTALCGANLQAARNDPRHGNIGRRKAWVRAGELAEFSPGLDELREPMTDLDPMPGRFAYIFVRRHSILFTSRSLSAAPPRCRNRRRLRFDLHPATTRQPQCHPPDARWRLGATPYKDFAICDGSKAVA